MKYTPETFIPPVAISCTRKHRAGETPTARTTYEASTFGFALCEGLDSSIAVLGCHICDAPTAGLFLYDGKAVENDLRVTPGESMRREHIPIPRSPISRGIQGARPRYIHISKEGILAGYMLVPSETECGAVFSDSWAKVYSRYGRKSTEQRREKRWRDRNLMLI